MTALKTICDTLLELFIKKGYKASPTQEQKHKDSCLNKCKLLQPRKKEKTPCLPISLTYSHTLPNVKNIIEKQWNILKKDPTSGNVCFCFTYHCISKKQKL